MEEKNLEALKIITEDKGNLDIEEDWEYAKDKNILKIIIKDK